MSLEWIGAKKRWREQPRRRGQVRLAALGGKIVGGERYWEEYYRKNVQNKMGGKSPGGANARGALGG